jgi:caa(3)-type oxidase subunit IV
VGALLLVFTALTVGISYLHFGAWNFLIGMAVATVKALLVILVFMNLRHDDRSNAIIFSMGFLFLVIFITLTVTDLFTREKGIYTDNQTIFKQVAGAPTGGPKFEKPWEPRAELVAHGKGIFAQQCVSCHGAEGQGNGAAAAALNPKPRNFTQTEGWKNGRKPAQIFKTLKEGIAGGSMGSFATIPSADRWALAHFVASLGPDVLKDTAADFAAIGFDPTKGATEEVAKPRILIEDAIATIAAESAKSETGRTGENIRPGGPEAASVGATDFDRFDKRLKAKTYAPY